MFTINIFKNEEIANIQYANNAVVLKIDTQSKSGNRTIKLLQFEGVEDTKDTTILKHLLKCMLAEFRVTDNFNSVYGTFETGATIKTLTAEEKEIVKTGIKAKRLFLPFLCTNTIYKTDSKGKLTHAISCDNGVTFKDTALNIKQEQLITLFGYNSQQFRSALHHTAKAILQQCSFISLIEKEHEEIEKGIAESAKQEQEQKQEQLKKQKQEQEKELKKTGTNNK